MATLEDLVASHQYSLMSSEEQLEKIRDVRRNKYVHKPALEKRQRKARKKSSTAVAKLLAGLSEKDREELLSQFPEE